DDMNCAEPYVRFLCQWLLDYCYDDMEFMTKFIDKTVLQRLEMVAKFKLHRVTYTEAVAILEEAAKVMKFE
ncbi:UNVERIFIED_CONTAM: Asparagine--tRNA ligase, cytoplasmic 1, partial [Sesamum radiatum]